MTQAEYIASLTPGQVLVMRGGPGSGKSTFANNLRAARPPRLRGVKGVAVVSADHYHVGADGTYRFDAANIGKAHGACLKRFLDYLTSMSEAHGVDFLIVDNTNIGPEEAAPYVALAAAFDVPCTVVNIVTAPDKAAARNVHDVPYGVAVSMAERCHRLQLPQRWNQVFLQGE